MTDTITARDVINQAAKDCGVLGVGQTLLAEDVNDAFVRLKNMMAQWQRRRWLVPSLYDVSAIGNNAKSNKIGDGQFWDTPRPDKIQAGYFVLLNSGNPTVSLPLWPIFSYEDYARITLKDLNTFPTYFFYDAQYPYGNVFIWPIPTSAYEIHLILKSQLGFSTTIQSGSIVTGGAGYVNGAYVAVPLVYIDAASGTGISATANITVAGGIVTVVALQNGGEFFKVGQLLTASAANLGGAGAGFAWRVDSTQSNLDSIMQLPPEFQEALIYNLSLRMSAMYQLVASNETKMLARAALNTIRMANVQVPTLRIPRTLQQGNGFSIYNPDNYNLG